MHKNVKISLLFLSIVLLIISGCEGTTTSTSVTGPYTVSGNAMIEAKFAKDLPISMENDPYVAGENIEVVVELTNKHTEDVPQGNVKVRLTGDASISNFFEGAQEVVAPVLPGYDVAIGQAIPEEVELGPIKYVADLPTKQSNQITGQYCYAYPVKVKAFLYYTDRSENIGTTLPSGTNPPSSVQVTKIDQQAVDVRDGAANMRFRVTIKNVGSGYLVPSMSECFTYRGRREREYVTVAAEGAYPITCENDGVVRLSSETKEKIVTCDVTGIDPSNLGTQPSELSLTLAGFAYESEIPSVAVWIEP
jgi:hypothetical protein